MELIDAAIQGRVAAGGLPGDYRVAVVVECDGRLEAAAEAVALARPCDAPAIRAHHAGVVTDFVRRFVRLMYLEHVAAVVYGNVRGDSDVVARSLDETSETGRVTAGDLE